MWNQLLQPKLFATACTLSKHGFLIFPNWYEYLPGRVAGSGCIPDLTNISDVWLIVLAITEILLRLAALVAFIFVLVGGVKLMTSQGNSKGTESGRETVINALIGLAISVFSAAIVAFIAGSFK